LNETIEHYHKGGEGEMGGQGEGEMVTYFREDFIKKLLSQMGKEMGHDDMKDGEMEKPEGPNDGTEGPNGEDEMEDVPRDVYLGKLFDGIQEKM
jgi:hypothetical protein